MYKHLSSTHTQQTVILICNADIPADLCRVILKIRHASSDDTGQKQEEQLKWSFYTSLYNN